MTRKASQREIGWHHSLHLVRNIWLFALALFILQSIMPDSTDREPVQVVLFLVLILLALPSTLLLLADWLRGRLRGRAGILAAYLLFIAAVAGIGALIGSLLLQPVPLLPLKLVIFVHLLLALGLLVCALGALLSLALARLYEKGTGWAAGPVLRLALNMFSLAAIYGLAQLLNHWLPLIQWLNFLWLFRL